MSSAGRGLVTKEIQALLAKLMPLQLAEDAPLLGGDSKRTPVTLSGGEEKIGYGQMALGAMGFCSILIYLTPGKTCAVTPECGGILSYYAPGVAPIFFSWLGGLDVGGMNLLFAIDPALRTVFSGKSGSEWAVITAIASATLIDKLLVALGTGASPLITAAIVMSAPPGALFGGVRIARGLFSTKTLIPHYEEERELFIAKLKSNWEQVQSRASHIKFKKSDDPYVFLFQQGAHVGVDRAILLSDAKRRHNQLLINIAGGSLVGGITATPIVINAFNKLGAHIPWMPLQLLATGGVCMSVLYAIFKLSIESVQLMTGGMRGQPALSIALELRKNMTFGMLFANTILSFWSYAVIDQLVDRNVSDADWKLRLRWAADIGIVMVHFVSLIHLFVKGLAKLSDDDRLTYLLRVAHKVEALDSMTAEEFFKVAIDEFERFGIKLLEQDKKAIDSRGAVRELEAPQDRHPLPAPAAVSRAARTSASSESSFWASACCWFSSCRRTRHSGVDEARAAARISL